MMMNSFSSLSLHLSPILPTDLLWIAGGLAGIIALIALWAMRHSWPLRALCTAILFGLLLSPVILKHIQKPVKDVIAVVVDRSPSQSFGQRTARTDEALATLKQEIGDNPSLDLRIIEAPRRANSAAISRTDLFAALNNAMADVPPARRAGVIIITDGQVHDVPQTSTEQQSYGPVQILLTGDHNEKDRRIVLSEAPSYGIVGKMATLRFKIEESAANDKNVQSADKSYIPVTISQESEDGSVNGSNAAANNVVKYVRARQEQSVQIKINHAGQNIIQLSVPKLDGELTTANNRLPVIINGVRDRLKVLLVSGQPHPGARTWRNILKADPGVDLVHFTILREPDKVDMTPQNELALIAFPFRELFEVKLYDFDLIIFDRYKLNYILPSRYFENIARYVEKGGAFLAVNGPAFVTQDSIYNTALKKILPNAPNGSTLDQAFKPKISKLGLRHPVTSDLYWPAPPQRNWGDWLRQVDTAPKPNTETIMTGANNLPLLTLARMGEGRTAQLTSDEIWLWARGYQGGGPQATLLRRLIHWLMKEPQLEENALNAEMQDDGIHITRRSLKDDKTTITIEAPDGTKTDMPLTTDGNPPADIPHALYVPQQPGVYKISDGSQTRFVMAGDPDKPELQDLLTTENKLATMVMASKGGFKWLADNPSLTIKQLPKNADYDLRGAIGLRENGASQTIGVREYPLLPPWAQLILALGVLLLCWYGEGRGFKNRKT